jgi:hypothetical protein
MFGKVLENAPSSKLFLGRSLKTLSYLFGVSKLSQTFLWAFRAFSRACGQKSREIAFFSKHARVDLSEEQNDGASRRGQDFVFGERRRFGNSREAGQTRCRARRVSGPRRTAVADHVAGDLDAGQAGGFRVGRGRVIDRMGQQIHAAAQQQRSRDQPGAASQESAGHRKPPV